MRSLLAIMMLISSYSPLSIADRIQILSVNESPSSFMNSDGNAMGFSVDVVKAIQNEIGNQSKIQVVPEARALLTALDKPSVLLFGFSRTLEREDKFHWITLLMRKPWVLYGKSENNIELDNLEDAKSFSRIGVVIGDVREQYLSYQGFNNLSTTTSHRQNLQMLQLSRIDLFFYEPLGLAYLCKELKIPMLNFSPVFRARTSDVYLMMSKNGTSPEAVNRWINASEKVKENGIFEAIVNEWSHRVKHETGLSYGLKDGAFDLLD